ncbi:hypothetical protein BGX28_000685 [Mortierella sp. GBA30]|nr:hypothetical protein BGX28_000685 [Mortierella sp. GBA30]
MKRHRRQQSQQQNQVQLENDQRYRQQQELHFVLARDRAMLQEQKELWRWQEFSDERVQHRQRHDVRKALDLELQLQQQQIFPHAQPRGGQAHFQFPTSVQMGASRRATMGRPQSISFGSRASEQKMGMATSAGTSASEPAANAGAPQSKRFHALSRPTHSSSRSLDTATLFSITETSS